MHFFIGTRVPPTGRQVAAILLSSPKTETMDNITGLLNLIPSVLILIAAIQLVSKFSQPEGYLLLIGAITSLASTFFYTFVIRFFDSPTNYFTIVGSIATLGHLCFGIGLFLLVRKLVTTKS
jgi:hypothetical protein